MYTKHIEGSLEGLDGSDAIYNGGNPNTLHIYSNNPLCNPNKLMLDARGPNSTTIFNIELYNKDFVSSADNFLRFNIKNNSNFEWKNIFLGDANDSNDIIADVKYIISSDGRTYADGTPYGDFQLPNLVNVSAGTIYDKRKIKFFNHADLNRDKKVNFQDFAIFANNWQRTGIVKGSDPNSLNDYADIQNTYDINGVMTSYGDGKVDNADLSEFVVEWLWNKDDPNTW